MQKPNDLNQSRIVLKQDSTLIAVIEMSLSSWLVAGIVPGVERQPLKKLAVDESALLKLLNRWREEAEKAGRRIERTTVAFEPAGTVSGWCAGRLTIRVCSPTRLWRSRLGPLASSSLVVGMATKLQ